MMRFGRSCVCVLCMVFCAGSSAFSNETLKKFNSDKGEFIYQFGKESDYSDVLVNRVVDGDTLRLETGERVRLIGIDTPEMHESQKLNRDSVRSGQSKSVIQKLGKQAYAFTRQLVEGKRVSLEFDVEKRDKYNRILAYVYLKDGTFVNAKIIEEGYASLMTYPPNVKYVDLFQQLYRQARENRRGLWK
ncbi:MAG TPA: thermonuclease family protein [Candidatus Omnitrophota bacterium]|nr:thermonuclease family protein [Candidatus Omnitrophota bacterium]HPT06818.1 thermonuclease family protein [Candidatus Omnitrophota bacterium]